MTKKSEASSNQNQLTHALGARIRALRLSRDMRILNLAQMTNLTSSMISQVERGGISPSIDTLKKIGNALNVPIGYFFEDDSDLKADHPDGSNIDQITEIASALARSGVKFAENSPVVHENQRKVLSPGEGVNFYLLNPTLDGPIEFIYNVYKPGCGTGEELYSHQGVECGLILEGELVVQILDKVYCLKKGDSITFDSSKPHSKMNKGTVPCICVWANSPPYF